MNKFKVGDIVVGTTIEDDIYSYTTEDAVMKVVDVIVRDGGKRPSEIRVKIISHKKYMGQIGNTYIVTSKFFKLRKPVSLENK